MQSLIIIRSNTNEISEKKDIIEASEKKVINEASEKNVINEASEKKDTNETSEKKIYLKLNFVTKREEERPKKKLRNQDIVQQALIIL